MTQLVHCVVITGIEVGEEDLIDPVGKGKKKR
jgi:hypothetical protein